MKTVFLALAIVLTVFATRPALAASADSRVEGEVSIDPVCSNIMNMAPYAVYGGINTNFFIRDDGIKTRHKSNFRLDPGHQVQFCTSGPFYEGRKVELVLRTLIPVFTCKTGVGGDIIITGRRKPEGGTETRAACLP